MARRRQIKNNEKLRDSLYAFRVVVGQDQRPHRGKQTAAIGIRARPDVCFVLATSGLQYRIDLSVVTNCRRCILLVQSKYKCKVA
jgi:hypothetical protein